MLNTLNWRLRRLERMVKARLSLLRMHRKPLLEPVTPILQMEYRAGADTRTLIVFLPGIGDLAEDFERHGFVHELRRRHLRVDAVAVDAHFGYYATRAVFERITDDVVDSARAAGYRDIWLVGVSMGGFGAACYAALHPGAVQGVLLLAPYVGDTAFVRQIDAAGGLVQWEPAAPAPNDFVGRLWHWLREHVRNGHQAPVLYLGYGANDKFAPANAVLGAALPSERVFVIRGGHDWRTWRRLWHLFLDRNAIGGNGGSNGGRAQPGH